MVQIFLADGFEEVEALTVIDVLRRGDVDIKSVSITEDPVVTGAHGIKVVADYIASEIEGRETPEAVVLPGGMPGAENLKNSPKVNTIIKQTAEEGKPVAAICAAPMVLASAGLLKNRKSTIYPGMEGELMGAEYTGASVTEDGNLITGEGPAKAWAFALALLEKLKGKEIRDEVAAGLLFE